LRELSSHNIHLRLLGLIKPKRLAKQQHFIEMPSRPQGVTIKYMATALMWVSDMVRGAMSGALKKKLKLEITPQKRS